MREVIVQSVSQAYAIVLHHTDMCKFTRAQRQQCTAASLFPKARGSLSEP